MMQSRVTNLIWFAWFDGLTKGVPAGEKNMKKTRGGPQALKIFIEIFLGHSVQNSSRFSFKLDKIYSGAQREPAA